MAAGHLAARNTTSPFPPQEEIENSTMPQTTYVGTVKINLKSQPTRKSVSPHEVKATSTKPSTSTEFSLSKPSYADLLKRSSDFSKNVKEPAIVNSAGIPTALVDLKPISQHQGKPAIRFRFSEKKDLIGRLKHVLIAKWSHGRPSMVIIRNFFSNLLLKGESNLAFFDSKHMLIECDMFEDFVNIWLKGVWMVNGYTFRVFKWSEDFHPSKESAITPVWIHLPRLPLFLYDEASLLSIANSVGRPLKIDPNNINRTKLGCASICVEVDVTKVRIDDIWITFSKDDSESLMNGFCQKVIYDVMPHFCQGCEHLGHSMVGCKRGLFPKKEQVQGAGSMEVQVLLRESSTLVEKVSVPNLLVPVRAAYNSLKCGLTEIGSGNKEQVLEGIGPCMQGYHVDLKETTPEDSRNAAVSVMNDVTIPASKEVATVEAYEDEVLVEVLSLEDGEIPENNGWEPDVWGSVAGEQLEATKESAVKSSTTQDPADAADAGLAWPAVSAPGSGSGTSNAGNTKDMQQGLKKLQDQGKPNMDYDEEPPAAADSPRQARPAVAVQTEVLTGVPAAGDRDGYQEVAAAGTAAQEVMHTGAELVAATSWADDMDLHDLMAGQANTMKSAGKSAAGQNSPATHEEEVLVKDLTPPASTQLDAVAVNHASVVHTMNKGAVNGTVIEQAVSKELQQGRTSLDTKVNKLDTMEGANKDEMTQNVETNKWIGPATDCFTKFQITQEENKAFTLFKERMHRLRGKEPERSSSLKVLAARSISPVGRSSEKMSKLRKRIENLKYEEGRAIVLEEETYKALEEYQQQLVSYHREKRQASSPKDSTPIADASHVIEQDRTTRKGRNKNREK